MAKKKKLRQKLLGSTKTGRLVRAASLAGVLGGGYLLSRTRVSSKPPSQESRGSPLSLAASPTPKGKKIDPASRVKYSSRRLAVPILKTQINNLRVEKNNLSTVASKDARKGVNREIKNQIVKAKTRVKAIPKEQQVAYGRLNKRQGNPLRARRRNK